MAGAIQQKLPSTVPNCDEIEMNLENIFQYNFSFTITDFV